MIQVLKNQKSVKDILVSAVNSGLRGNVKLGEYETQVVKARTTVVVVVSPSDGTALLVQEAFRTNLNLWPPLEQEEIPSRLYLPQVSVFSIAFNGSAAVLRKLAHELATEGDVNMVILFLVDASTSKSMVLNKVYLFNKHLGALIGANLTPLGKGKTSKEKDAFHSATYATISVNGRETANIIFATFAVDFSSFKTND